MTYGQANIRYEIYLLIKYIKSVIWRVEKRLSYIEDARCLKVNLLNTVCFDKKLVIFKCFKTKVLKHSTKCK